MAQAEVLEQSPVRAAGDPGERQEPGSAVAAGCCRAPPCLANADREVVDSSDHHLTGCLAVPRGTDAAGGLWPRLASRGGRPSLADGRPTGDFAQTHTGSCCVPVEPFPEG